MNEARRVVVAMGKPMAEVAKTIEENTQAAKNAIDKTNLHAQDMSTLEQSFKIKGIDLKRKEIGHPRTVCAHKDCTEQILVPSLNIKRVNYKQICHDPCTLRWIPSETPKRFWLKFCKCFRWYGVTCRECGHHYKDHMHLTYDMEKVQTEFISDEGKKEIMAKKTEKEKSEEWKKQIEIKLKELEFERKTILHVSAKYGAFLKDNAMIPYNDAIGDYLDMFIELEKNDDESITHRAFLKQLKKLRAEYDIEKKSIDDAMTHGESTNSNEIMQLQQQLFELKHFGKTLKDIFDRISIASSSQNIKFREIVAPIHQGTRWVKEKWNSLWTSSSDE